jgi:predicted AAA+ superfamily ATPase
MEERVFKRKLYQKMLDWKLSSQGKTALLIEGARRVGKSTLVNQFAAKEYKSAIIIDFNLATDRVIKLFDDLMDLSFLFFQLQQIYQVQLFERESVIVFDEVQRCPKARQAIKYLVADGRYDYIETGSLISIHQNTTHITIPSEERRLEMFPMDYEEFSWAIGEDKRYPLLQLALNSKMSMGASHREQMRNLRLYMLIGGMPQAVNA